MLKIWGRPNSINVQKAMWAVGELGLEHERIDVGNACLVTGPERMVISENLEVDRMNRTIASLLLCLGLPALATADTPTWE